MTPGSASCASCARSAGSWGWASGWCSSTPCSTVLGPVLVKVGIDQGVVDHSLLALGVATVIYLVVVLADWVDTWAENRYTGRTAERLLFALRVRIFSHLQRLALDYYEREMAGRIMTRMTTDVEALSQLLQTGLVNALVNLFSFVGVAIALVVMDFRLSLVTFIVLPPLLAGTWWFRQRSRPRLRQARERIAVVNANFQENLSGVRVAQAYVREGRNEQTFRQVSSDYLGVAGGGPAPRGHLLPVRPAPVGPGCRARARARSVCWSATTSSAPAC